ncbi:MAG: hypothetical protein HC887_06265 [Desulfobacteraceae bacterium]|nr:hypothetical protein [Desulfobacteraceae bacterium]
MAIRQMPGRTIILISMLLCCVNLVYASEKNKNFQSIEKLIGENDAVLITDPLGNIVLSKHADKPLAPASTFKLLTSLAAIQYLGMDYRFGTEFYIDGNANLIIKGFGDPMLVSEVLPDICKHCLRLSEQTPKSAILFWTIPFSIL